MQEHGTNRAPLYQLYICIGYYIYHLNFVWGVYGFVWKMGKIEQKKKRRENDDDICPGAWDAVEKTHIYSV